VIVAPDRLMAESAQSDEERAHEWTAMKVGAEFRAANPDLELGAKQIALLDAVHAALGLPMTVEGVTRAYQILKNEESL